MRIRPVDDSDFEAIAALTNRFIVETAIHFGYEPVSAEELRAEWRVHRERYPYIVAIDGAGRFAGYAKAGLWRERSAYRWTAETGIYLEEHARGLGLGRRLYGELIERCRTAGFHALVAGVTLPNEPSLRLHRAVGFVDVGTFARVGWKFGRWHDVAFLELLLASADAVPAVSPSP